MRMRHYQLCCAIIPALVFAMCQAESYSARLTAFGKTNTQNPGKGGRECKTSSECTGIENTTCVNDPRDNKMRCLCRENTPPINGACPNQSRAVRAPCTADEECTYGSECKLLNTTQTSRTKVCLCKLGYVEENQYCSDSFSETLDKTVDKSDAVRLCLPGGLVITFITIVVPYLTNKYGLTL